MNALAHHVPEDGFSYASLTSSERRRIVNTCFVHRKWSREVETHIAELREDRLESAEATCIIVKGDRGLGKTTLLKKMRDEAAPPSFQRDGACRQLIQPIVYVTFPPNLNLTGASKVLPAALKGLDWTTEAEADEACDELDGAEAIMGLIRGNRSDLDRRIIWELQHQRVEVVLCDEFQNVGLNQQANETPDAIAQWVAYIMKTSNVPFVLAGTAGVDTAANLAKALIGLTFQEYVVAPFAYDTDKQIKAFQTFLRKFDAALPFDQRSGLGDSRLAKPIHDCTEGNLRTLRHLIRYAARQAISTGQPAVTEANLHHAFERMKSYMNLPVNPFASADDEED